MGEHPPTSRVPSGPWRGLENLEPWKIRLGGFEPQAQYPDRQGGNGSWKEGGGVMNRARLGDLVSRLQSLGFSSRLTNGDRGPPPPSSPEKPRQWATYAGVRESASSWWAWGCQATERSVVARLGSMKGDRMKQLAEMKNRGGHWVEWGTQTNVRNTMG